MSRVRRRQAKGNLITTSEGDHGSVMPFQLLRRGRTPGRVGNTTRFFVASVPCLGAYLGKVPTYSSLQPTLAALNLNALNLQDSPDRNDTYLLARIELESDWEKIRALCLIR